MKYTIGKFVLDHSEDYKDGKCLIMNLGTTGQKGKQLGYDIDILLWDAFEGESWVILQSMNSRNPYHDKLTQQEKRWAILSLFKSGIRDDR